MKLLFSDIVMDSKKSAYIHELTIVRMSPEQKVKIVSSIYSNVKKLRVAQLIYNNPNITWDKIVEETKYPGDTVSKIIRDMLICGVIRISGADGDRRKKPISMTALGIRLMKL